MRAVALLAVLVAGLAIPSAAGEPVRLYAHVVDPVSEFAINTQEPPEAFAFDLAAGVATSTLTCLPSLPGLGTSQRHHTMFGYSSPAFVEYGFAEGGPRVHPERGLSADVRLDPAAPMVLHWYLSEPDPTEAGTPVPVPNVVVQATMRAGDAIGPDQPGYDSGPVLAQGQSAPAVLAGGQSQGVELDTVDGRTVYHFRVPMTIDSPVIPRATGFILGVDVFVENPACSDDGTVMPNSVLLHTSPGHRPRLEFGALGLLQLEYIHPQFVGSDFVVHTAVIDVWGVYDLASFNATLSGPGMPVTELTRMAYVYETSEHRRYTNSAELAWMLEGVATLPHGTYTMTLTATTLQGHGETWQATFEFGERQEAPSLPAAALVLALAATAVAARRRI